MKIVLVLLMSAFAVSAQAQLIVPKGTKGTLKVTYEFKSEGRFVSPAKDVKSDWNVRRFIEITGQYVAEMPQPVGALHERKQQKETAGMQAKVEDLHKTMQPTMNDMMKIVEKCAEDEACIEREIQNYGKQMDLATVQKGKQQADEAVKAATAGNYQLWTLVSQQGSYDFKEVVNRQVYEATCTDVQICKRTETKSGSGKIAPPKGGKGNDGVSILEVDSAGKDMMVILPMPLSTLPYTRTVTTTIPDEASSTSEHVSDMWMLKAQKPNPVTIPGNLGTVSGTQSWKIDGHQEAGGTLTVHWTFTRL